MSVLGVLTCEVLELEFAYLLARDVELKRTTIFENDQSSRLVEALKSSRAGSLCTIGSLGDFTAAPGNRTEVLLRVLELGLHNRQKTLQEGLREAACEMGPHVDALILGYGLCGNALEKPDELLRDARVPIFIPMDEDHPVDDCVGLLIGGRSRYYSEQCKVAGTFFMIPGWTTHWRRMFEQEFGRLDMETAKMLFKNYERSLLIPTPVMSEEEMAENAAEFSRMFGFRTETRPGTMRILLETWQDAKQHLAARGT